MFFYNKYYLIIIKKFLCPFWELWFNGIVNSHYQPYQSQHNEYQYIDKLNVYKVTYSHNFYKNFLFMLEDNEYVRYCCGWGSAMYWSWTDDGYGYRAQSANRSIGNYFHICR